MDIFEVSDPAEIKALANDPRLDRKFETRTCPFNWVLLKRSLMVLSFSGRRFPTMMPRNSAQRELDQQQLWKTLSAKAAAMQSGPEELEPLASWVKGIGPESQVGMLAQQLLGGLFSSTFIATPESWAAAETLVAAPRRQEFASHETALRGCGGKGRLVCRNGCRAEPFCTSKRLPPSH